MSTPTMNHGSQTQQQTEQQQQQQQQMTQTSAIQSAHSSSSNSLPATLTRSDSTSTVILEEEETRTCRRNGARADIPPALLASLSAQLRSLWKTGGLFNTDMEGSDKLKEFFASGNGFALERLLSEVDPKDFNLNAEDLIKLDSFKLDARTLSEFIRSESFDQLIASAAMNTDGTIQPHAMSSATSFSELRSVSPDLQKDASHPALFTPIHSVDVSSTMRPPQGTLNAIQHDHAFLAKRNPADDAPSSSTTISKRTQGRRPTRTSTRLQSRAVCTSNAAAASSESDSSTRIKRGRNVNRAKDVQTPDDLNYYLERRRKNNEASKVSRAVRKQKFGDMDEKCDEYERVNMELRTKISTLEKVTASLKNGLVNNFQRKN